MLKISRRGQVPPFIVMDVMQAAADREANGGEVLHLEVGQPSTSAPAGVIAAAHKALDTDRAGYTVAFGIPDLRHAIARHYRDSYGVEIGIDRIAVTTGSSGAFTLGFLAAFEAGDRVALASPGYPAYRNILSALNIEVVDLLTGPETRFQPTPELLERSQTESGKKIDGLIVASPSNPTGTILGASELASLCDYCRKSGIRLVSDEIYHGISYGTSVVTALDFGDDAIIINSFSKYFSMTGWRLGWMILPPELVRSAECLAQNFFISPPTLSQLAAVAAFDCREELDGNVRRYAANRDILLKGLPDAGLSDIAPPDGAFYVYANVSRITNDAADFCRRLLNDTGIAITPGNDFDPQRGDGYVRFSYAGSEDTMREACTRLKDWLA
jgi:aspartate/methionine/tyrosine aminotransferase